MTYACMECAEGLPQYKAGYCARCIADEEAHEYEAEDAEVGRDECERETPNVCRCKHDNDWCHVCREMLKPSRMTHEGREYYRLADGVELSETDRHTFNRALFGPINWPRRQGQVSSDNMALGNEYWRPVEVVVELVEPSPILRPLEPFTCTACSGVGEYYARECSSGYTTYAFRSIANCGAEICQCGNVWGYTYPDGERPDVILEIDNDLVGEVKRLRATARDRTVSRIRKAVSK